MPRLVITLLVAALLGGCGEHSEQVAGDAVAPGRNLRVYASLPLHGDSALPARAAADGMRHALEARGGRVGRYRIELVLLDSSAAGTGPDWNPARVAHNAEVAVANPKAIAYLGELVHGGSGVSLPITNAGGMLQIAPEDGLTGLVDGASRPASARERFYPSGRRTFQRLVSEDRVQAQALVTGAIDYGSRRVALLRDGSPYARAIVNEVVDLARCDGLVPLEPEGVPGPGDSEATAGLAQRLRSEGADTVVYLGADSLSRTLADALARALPGAPLLAAGATARSPAPGLDGVVVTLPTTPVAPPDRVDYIYGFDAMALALDAIDRAGPRGASRPVVARLGVERRTYKGRAGRYELDGRGNVEDRPITLARVDDGRLTDALAVTPEPCR